jgi:hypothetical protein
MGQLKNWSDQLGAQRGCTKWQGITRQELGARWVSSMGVSLSEVRHWFPHGSPVAVQPCEGVMAALVDKAMNIYGSPQRSSHIFI